MPTFGSVEHDWLWLRPYKLRGSRRWWLVLVRSQAENHHSSSNQYIWSRSEKQTRKCPQSRARTLTP